VAILKTLGGSIFASSARAAISSSATFLIVFIVVHAFGNLTALVSGDAFNRYGHKLHSLGTMLFVIEAYLFAGFAVHSAVGIYLTLKDGKLSLKRFSWTQARLALSGSVLLAFVVIHVRTFRFGPWYTTSVDGVEMRDIWRLQKEVFSSLPVVVWYIVAVVILGAHLFWGWQKTVRKPQGLGGKLPKKSQDAAVLIGNAMAVAVTAAFIVAPVYTFAQV